MVATTFLQMEINYKNSIATAPVRLAKENIKLHFGKHLDQLTEDDIPMNVVDLRNIGNTYLLICPLIFFFGRSIWNLLVCHGVASLLYYIVPFLKLIFSLLRIDSNFQFINMLVDIASVLSTPLLLVTYYYSW